VQVRIKDLTGKLEVGFLSQIFTFAGLIEDARQNLTVTINPCAPSRRIIHSGISGVNRYV